MTYTDLAAQSPETQAAVEQEIRVLLKVCVICYIMLKTNSAPAMFFKKKITFCLCSLTSFLLLSPGVI